MIKLFLFLNLFLTFSFIPNQDGSRLKWEYEVIHFANSDLQVARVMCQGVYRSELFLCRYEDGSYELRLYGAQTATDDELHKVNIQIYGTNESWNYDISMICLEDEADKENNYLFTEMSNKKGDSRAKLIEGMKKGNLLNVRIPKLNVDVSFTLSGSNDAFKKIGL